MKIQFTLITAAITIAGCGTAPSSSPGDSSFQLCESEAFFSLSTARQYFASGKNRSAVLPFVGQSPKEIVEVNEMFRRIDSGEIKHYATYASETLHNCARREGAKLTIPMPQTERCFALTDIPFLLFLAKEQGQTKGNAVEEVNSRTQSRYETAFIQSVADNIFPSSNIDQARRTTRALFWSCMYP